MYKYIFFNTIILFLHSTLYAETPRLYTERLLTDFAGVVTNGSTVLCYGNYGIITSSSDFGETWQQISIGDKYNIKRILSIDKNYFAITNFGLFISRSDGRQWQYISIPKAVDMAIYKDSLYILTPSAILRADINGTFETNPVLLLDTTSNYSEIAVSSTGMYCIVDDRYILRYQFATKQITKKDVVSEVNPACFNCKFLKNIQVHNDSVYILVYNTNINGILPIYLARTVNHGDSWTQISKPSGYYSAYMFNDYSLYAVCTQQLSTSLSYLFGTGCIRINSNKAENLSVADTLPDRMLRYFSSSQEQQVQEYTGIVKVNDSVFIAAGKDKLISRSTNSGKSWKLLSYIMYTANSALNLHCPTENLSYTIGSTRRSIYHTSNGGITWLPQRYNGYPKTSNFNNIAHFFDTKGNGFLVLSTINPNDSNIYVTHDSGETFTPIQNVELFHTLDTTIFSKHKFSTQLNTVKAIDVGGMYCIAGKKTIRTANGDNTLPFSYIIRFDSTFRYLDSALVKANQILHIHKTEEGNLYAMCMNSSGPVVSDSLSGLDSYSSSFFMMRSTDKGATWDSIATYLPTRKFVIQKIGTKFYVIPLVGQNCTATKSHIVYLISSGKTLLRFSLSTATFDTIEVPSDINTDIGTLFMQDNLFYAPSRLQKIYFTNISVNSPFLWDSISYTHLLEQWKSPINNSSGKNTDYIAGTTMINDSTGVIVSAILEDFKVNGTPNNLLRVRSRSSLTSIDASTENIEYLWNAAPYPIPVNHTVNTTIYWENGYTINDLKFQMFDLFGTPIANPLYSFDRSEEYAGVLRWNCSNLPAGVYVIRVYIAKNSRLIPILKL